MTARFNPKTIIISCNDENGEIFSIMHDKATFVDAATKFANNTSNSVMIPFNKVPVEALITFIDDHILPEDNNIILQMIKVAEYCELRGGTEDGFEICDFLVEAIYEKIYSESKIDNNILSEWIIDLAMEYNDLKTCEYVITEINAFKAYAETHVKNNNKINDKTILLNNIKLLEEKFEQIKLEGQIKDKLLEEEIIKNKNEKIRLQDTFAVIHNQYRDISTKYNIDINANVNNFKVMESQRTLYLKSIKDKTDEILRKIEDLKNIAVVV
jgi:hypothetical protein